MISMWSLRKLQFHLQSRFNVRPMVGVELEFYVKMREGSTNNQKLLEDFQSNVITEGLHIVQEKGNNQYEIDIPHTGDLLDLLRQLGAAKETLMKVARLLGMDVVFAAKPFCNDYGSALHVHVSLHDDEGTNVYGMCSLNKGQNYLNSSVFGILDLLDQGLALFCGDEDFARFVPNMMCPTNISWGGNNRTTAIRIPTTHETGRRLEFRVAPANAPLECVLEFLLIGIYHGLTTDRLYFPKIHGNAFDEQYALQILPKDLKMAYSIFDTKQRLKEYVRFFRQ